MSDLREYKCPACGGAMEFDSGSQKMKCPFCDTEVSIEEFEQEQKKNPEETRWEAGNGAQWKEDEISGMQFILVSPVAVKLQQTKQQELRHVRSVEIVLF